VSAIQDARLTAGVREPLCLRTGLFAFSTLVQWRRAREYCKAPILFA